MSSVWLLRIFVFYFQFWHCNVNDVECLIYPTNIFFTWQMIFPMIKDKYVMLLLTCQIAQIKAAYISVWRSFLINFCSMRTAKIKIIVLADLQLTNVKYFINCSDSHIFCDSSFIFGLLQLLYCLFVFGTFVSNTFIKYERILNCKITNNYI